MQNSVWKITALIGVVGIGALVMFQAQRGLSRPVAESAAESGDTASTDPNSAPEVVLGPQQEPAESHTDHNHANHDHDAAHYHKGNDASLQSSGLDFRKPADAPLNSQPGQIQTAGTDTSANHDDAPELTKVQPKNSTPATNDLGEDPFGESNATNGNIEPKPEPIKAASHDVDTESIEPAELKTNSESRAPGAGPRLLDPGLVSDPEPIQQAEPRASDAKKSDLKDESNGGPAIADEIDPFGDANAEKSKQEIPEKDKPDSLKPVPEPEKEASTAIGELNELGPTLEPKKLDASKDAGNADGERGFPRKSNLKAPANSLPDPQPDPTAFEEPPTKDRGDATKAPGKLDANEETPLDRNNDGPTIVPSKPLSEKDSADPAHDDARPAAETPGPRISLGAPDAPAQNERSGGAERPKTLELPSEAAPLQPTDSEEMHGDGTLEGNAPRGPQRPQLTIEKIAPPNAQLGQPLIYSILVKNVGNSTAHEVVVEDRIPKGTKLSGTIPRAELAGKTLIWKLGDLRPDQQQKISIRVVPIEAGQIGSVATVNFVAEVAAETNITAPQLRIDLTGPSEAKLGDAVPFHFRVTNTGSGDASGVIIRDIIPEGFKHPAGNDLEYEVGRLPAGQSREIKLALTAAKIGPTVNRAVVTAEGGVSSEAKVAVEIYGTKIVVKRTGPTRRYVGRQANYTNTIINESPRPVETVTVTETVPEGMEFVEASNGGQYNEGSRTIAWRLNRLAAAEERTLKVTLLPKATGNMTSVVRAAATGNDVVEATSQTIVEGFASVNLEMESVDGPVDVGEKVTLHIIARNRGNSAATNVAVTIDVPDQFKIVSAKGPSKHEQSGNEIRFEPISAIDGRTTAAIDLVLEARAKGDARVKVQIRGDQLETPLSREEAIMVLSDGQ